MSAQFPEPINPDDLGRGPLVMGLNWTFTILCVLFVAARFWVRKKIAGFWGWDDWLMLASAIFQVAGECLFTVSYYHGFGKHDHSIYMPDQFVEIMKWAWIAMGPGQMTSILARISIAITLISIFGIHKWFKWFLIIATSAQTAFGIVMLVLSYAQARPIEGLWNVFLPDVWRLDTAIFINIGYTTQSLYTFTDVAFVALPVAIIWKLNMALHRKIGLIVLMAFSLFTATMSILKTYTIHWQGDPSVTDPLYRNSLQVLFANLEQACVIIMGCIPTLRPIVKVELPFGLSKVTKSISSLISRTIHSTRGSSTAQSQKSFTEASSKQYSHSAGAYHEIEMGRNREGRQPGSTDGSTRTLVGANQVRRTDQFTVSYDDDANYRQNV